VKISVIIPTRSRARYLRETLQTVAVAIAACPAEVEVVVSDNDSEDDTAYVCAQSGIAGLIHVRQPARLSMRQNFEAGLAASSGSHVVFIGDDDGVAPHGLQRLQEIIASGDHDSFKWRVVNYIWPDPDRGRQGGVVLRTNKLSGRVRRINPKTLLADFETARINGYQSGAMIYHGCISRHLIDKVRAAQEGTYFWTTCPDVYASVANLLHAETDVLAVDIPITIGGASPRSNGTAGKEYTQTLKISPGSEYAKFVAELQGDPCLGRTPPTCPSINLVTIDALQLAHRFAGRKLHLNEAGWLTRVEAEIRPFPALLVADARRQAAMLLGGVAAQIAALPSHGTFPTLPVVPEALPEPGARTRVDISLAKVIARGGEKMAGIVEASQVIDTLAGASTPFARLPGTTFGMVLRIVQLLRRAHAFRRANL